MYLFKGLQAIYSGGVYEIKSEISKGFDNLEDCLFWVLYKFYQIIAENTEDFKISVEESGSLKSATIKELEFHFFDNYSEDIDLQVGETDQVYSVILVTNELSEIVFIDDLKELLPGIVDKIIEQINSNS